MDMAWIITKLVDATMQTLKQPQVVGTLSGQTASKQPLIYPVVATDLNGKYNENDSLKAPSLIFRRVILGKADSSKILEWRPWALIYSGLLISMFWNMPWTITAKENRTGPTPSTTSSSNLKINLWEHRPGHLSLTKSEFALTRKIPVTLRTLMREKFNTHNGNFNSVLTSTLCVKQKGDSRTNQARFKDYRPWVPDRFYY